VTSHQTGVEIDHQPGQHPPARNRGRQFPPEFGPPSASPNAAVRPATSARSATSRDPACEATPRPSALTVTTGRVAVVFTYEVPSLSGHSCL
jgi:hypothetical protein